MAQCGDGLEATQGAAAVILMNQNYSETELTQLLQICWMDVVSLPIASHSGHSSLIWGDGGKEKKFTTTIFLERKIALLILTPMRIFWKRCILAGSVPRCLASKDSMPKWEITLRRYPHLAVPCAQVPSNSRQKRFWKAARASPPAAWQGSSSGQAVHSNGGKQKVRTMCSCNKGQRTSPGCGPPQLRVCLHDGPWWSPTVTHAFCTVCPI